MKTKAVVRILLLFIVIFSFSSCEKADKIDINQLIGKWHFYNDDPNLAVDGSVAYEFHVDNTCVIYIHDFLTNSGLTLNRIYTISHDNTLLTLTDEDNKSTEQYYIRKLTANEMLWERVTSGYGMLINKFRKYTE